MKVIKRIEAYSVHIGNSELRTLIKLHQALIDRGMCPHVHIGEKRDLSDLEQYLSLLPELKGEQGRRSVLISDVPRTV